MTIDAITFGLPVIPSLFGDNDLARFCAKCECWRRDSQFLPNHRTCIICKERSTRSHRKSIVQRRVKDVARRYGLSSDEVLAMREDQNNLCAICGKPETKAKKDGHIYSLSVDHDHATGTVRGALCQRCNLLIATLERCEPATVYLAWKYLGAHK